MSTDEPHATMVRVQRQLMSAWSETNWCAGWMLGLEEELWHGSNKEMRPYDLDIADIHVFAKTTGVWCTYEADVPLDQWEAQHGPPLTRMADREPTPAQLAVLERVNTEVMAHVSALLERFGRSKETHP